MLLCNVLRIRADYVGLEPPRSCLVTVRLFFQASLELVSVCPPHHTDVSSSDFFSCAVVSQFGISGAAVARVWADKVLEWVALGEEDAAGAGTEMRRFWMFALDPLPGVLSGISPLAGLLQAACVLVLLRGVEMGKRVTTVMTAIKVMMILED